MTVASALATADVDQPQSVGSRELKFTLPGARVDLARCLLDAVCWRDADHPAAYVSTIYYDTKEFTTLSQKVNSEYLKLKIRVRWYSDLEKGPSGPAFVEAKMRTGTARAKLRVPAPYGAETLARCDLQDPRLQQLPLLLRDQGIVLRDLWQPILTVRYRRDRFVEPVTRARISLDAEIAASAVNRGLISAADCSPLGVAILEVKGSGDQLPGSLYPFVRLGARKRSFSKYLVLLRHVTRSIS